MAFKNQGMLCISVNQTETLYLLRPLASYLSPDNKHAVLYGDVNASDGENAKLIRLDDDSKKLTLDKRI